MVRVNIKIDITCEEGFNKQSYSEADSNAESKDDGSDDADYENIRRKMAGDVTIFI